MSAHISSVSFAKKSVILRLSASFFVFLQTIKSKNQQRQTNEKDIVMGNNAYSRDNSRGSDLGKQHCMA